VIWTAKGRWFGRTGAGGGYLKLGGGLRRWSSQDGGKGHQPGQNVAYRQRGGLQPTPVWPSGRQETRSEDFTLTPAPPHPVPTSQPPQAAERKLVLTLALIPAFSPEATINSRPALAARKLQDLNQLIKCLCSNLPFQFQLSDFIAI